MFRLGFGSQKDLTPVLERARTGEPTYDALGATRATELPEGFRHDHHEVDLGHGPSSFERAKEGLKGWQAHVGAGAEVYPGGAFVEGDTVLVLLRFAPLRVIAPCRIIYIVDEHDRFGLAYGTLPGHPEDGEESFLVERVSGGSVVFRITAFSRPAHIVTRLGAPLTRALQLYVTRGYLEALARYVAAGGAG